MEKDSEEKIKTLFSHNFGIEENNVNPSLELLQDLNLSHLEIADFLLILEDTFHIEIPKEESEKFVTLGDIIDYVVNHESVT